MFEQDYVMRMKKDSLLEEHNYTREEIASGLTDMTSQYDVKDFVEMFME